MLATNWKPIIENLEKKKFTNFFPLTSGDWKDPKLFKFEIYNFNFFFFGEISPIQTKKVVHNRETGSFCLKIPFFLFQKLSHISQVFKLPYLEISSKQCFFFFFQFCDIAQMMIIHEGIFSQIWLYSNYENKKNLKHSFILDTIVTIFDDFLL